MPSGKRIVQNYEELAALTEQRGDGQMRDRFLILAADTALANGLRDDAERLRARLLQINPHHLLRPYPTLREALKSPDVAHYVADLRDTFPPEEAFRLLERLRADAGTTAAPAPPEPGSGENAPELETLQIYRFSDAEEAAPPSAPPSVEPPAEKPVAARPRTPESPVAPPIAIAPPVEVPEVFPYPAEPPVPRSRRRRDSEADEPASALSVAVSSTLFGLVLLAGVAILIYTVARPFLAL
jgi:hypothetical protein